MEENRLNEGKVQEYYFLIGRKKAVADVYIKVHEKRLIEVTDYLFLKKYSIGQYSEANWHQKLDDKFHYEIDEFDDDLVVEQ